MGNINIGDSVEDKEKIRGRVIEIITHNPLNPIEDHGFITVLRDDGAEEHYAEFNWERYLRVL